MPKRCPAPFAPLPPHSKSLGISLWLLRMESAWPSVENRTVIDHSTGLGAGPLSLRERVRGRVKQTSFVQGSHDSFGAKLKVSDSRRRRGKRLPIWLILVLVALFAPALQAAQNPFDQAAPETFAGRFANREVMVRLKPESGKWTGTILFRNKSYSIQADQKDGRLEGVFGEEDWPFTARSDGNSLFLTAGTFSATLPRRKLPEPKGLYQSRHIKIVFQNQDQKVGGLITYNGKDYQFTVTEAAGDWEGVFRSENESFPFSLANEGEGLVFQTGKFTELVRRPMASDGDEFENSLGMKFVALPGASLLCSVWKTRVKDYAAYAAAVNGVDGLWRNADYKGVRVSNGPEHPVTMTSWDDARAFCAWLTDKERKEGLLATNKAYRLPTDAEWSRAAGLSTETGANPREKSGKVKGVWPWGTDWPPPSGVANLADRAAKTRFADATVLENYDDGFPTTAPVGSFKPNALGLYDMAGNAWEWCEDWGDPEQTGRVLRGGSWLSALPDLLLSSYRYCYAPNSRHMIFGFRIVLGEAAASP